MGISRAFVAAVMVLVVLAAGLAAVLRLRAAMADTTPGTQRIELVVDGAHRSYLLDLPAGDAAAGTHPLLILLHGGGGSAESLDKQTGNLPAMATAAGYAVARPDGIGHQWNDGRGVNPGVDDVAFMRAIVKDVGARTALDPGGVFAAGMSNGAFMSGRLACEPGFAVAGIAQVVGTLGVDTDAACDPDRPVPVLAILGDDDPIVPYAGGPVRLPWDRSEEGRGIVLGADAYLDAWMARNATGPADAGPSIAPDASALVATGPDGTEVELVTVAGGGHGWPGGPQYLPDGLIGHVTDSFSASALMLEFFERTRDHEAGVSPPSAAASASASPPAGSTPSTPPPSEVPGLTPVPAAGNAVADRILATIDEGTGSALMDLAAEVEAWGVQVDGTLDDGDGPGRLLVVVSPPAGTAANLCQDSDFVQGGRCRQVEVPNGDVRFERGLVEFNGVRTVVVAIRRADGSGVLLEADNFRFDPPPVLVAGQPRPTPEITRPDPVLGLAELVDLADAISAATRNCAASTCP